MSEATRNQEIEFNGSILSDRSTSRRFISWGGSLYARTILGVPVRDLTGGFNGFRLELEKINLAEVSSAGYCFQVELKYRACKAGLRVVESPMYSRTGFAVSQR